MAQDNNTYGSNPKPTEQIKAWGLVVNIADPLNSGRVQVRMVGYEDNKGTVPDDMLIWYDTDIQGHQIKGVGASHRYSVGSTVKMENSGGKWTVVGAGTGSGDPKSNSDEIDTKDGGYPKGARKSSPGLIDVKLNVKGVDLLSDLRDKVKFDAKSLLQYAADESNGSAAKFKDLPNIGSFLADGRNNATNFIKGLDPSNLSGAISQGLNVVNNFLNSPLGPLSSMLGSTALGGMLSQIQSSFGPLGLVAQAASTFAGAASALSQISNLASNLNPQNLLNNIGMIENLPSLLSDPMLNIPLEVRSQLESAVSQVSSDVLNNNLTSAISKVQNLLPLVQNASAQIGPMASQLSSLPIPNLPVADLIKDFSGGLTPIKPPKLPNLKIGKYDFPNIPTFAQEQALKAANMSQALTGAISQITSAAGAVQGVSSAVSSAGSLASTASSLVSRIT
jgi:hypothetical protein